VKGKGMNPTNEATGTNETAKPKQRWFWLRDEHRFPVACIASGLLDCNCPDYPGLISKSCPSHGFEASPARVQFALSIVNPKDHFDRRRGREIALARLAKGKAHGEAPLAGAKRAILSALAADVKLFFSSMSAAEAARRHHLRRQFVLGRISKYPEFRERKR
jgi:hypothetical protein